MNSGTCFTGPISFSMRSTASLAPPCSGPASAPGRAGQRRVRIGLRAADAAHRARAAVLLVIGVQDEQHVERALEHGVHACT